MPEICYFTISVDFSTTITKNPELYREKSSNFDNPKGVNNGDIQKFVSWLEEKFRMSKHANMINVPSRFLNITRAKSENYAEVRKLAETMLPKCLSILLLLKQAQMTDIDSQTLTMNVEFNPTANIAVQNLRNCGANILTNTDSQITIKNVEFNPKANTAAQNLRYCKANMNVRVQS